MAMSAFKMTLVSVVAVVVGMGCSSQAVRIGARPPDPYQTLGLRSGSACGLLLVDAIPIGVNDRVARAYADALRDGQGTALLDPTIQNTWYWTPVGNLLCVDIRGDAVR
jgi:hypothetical protein